MMLGTFAAESKTPVQTSLIPEATFQRIRALRERESKPPMKLHLKIRELRRRAGLTQQELAQAVSAKENLTQPILRQAVTMWEAGSSRPEKRRLPVVAEILGTTVEELLSSNDLPPFEAPPPHPLAVAAREIIAGAPAGLPPPAAEQVVRAAALPHAEHGRRPVRVPIAGDVRAEHGHLLLGLLDVPSDAVDYPTIDVEAYALRVIGDALAPRYRAGEFIVLEPSFKPQPGDDVLVRCKNGRVHLCPLAWQRDGMIQLYGESGPTTFQMSEVEAVHTVGGHVLRKRG